MKQREERKWEHIRLALAIEDGPQSNGLEDIRLIPSGVSGFDLTDIDLATTICGKTLNYPIYINAITGGAEGLGKINEQLAIIARENGIGIAVGSQKAAIDNPKLRDTFEIVRKVYPDGMVMANISANSTVEEGLAAVEMVEADLLQLHINLAQELVMSEGDRAFGKIQERILGIKENVPVPVVVKEVGFGVSYELVMKLVDMGIKWIDVGGTGGTNFVAIEQQRAGGNDHHYLLDWGIPTATSIVETNYAIQNKASFFASGGIRNSMEIAKCLVMGAKACGIARPVLEHAVNHGTQSGVRYIEKMGEQLRELYLLLGAKHTDGMREIPYIVTGDTRQWVDERRIRKYN